MHKWQKTAEEIRKHLQAEVAVTVASLKPLTSNFFSLTDFVAKLAIPFEPAAYDPERYPSECTIKECYSNAGKLALDHNDLTYVEGYAMGVIPVLHAWCVTEDGLVVDPTWAAIGIGTAYLGIPFKASYAVLCMLKREKYGILDWWEDEWPILRADPNDFLEVAAYGERTGHIREAYGEASPVL